MSLSTTTNTSGRTAEQDAVICALIGLARAAEAKEIPAGTAPVLFAALASVAPGGSLSSSAANDLVEQIHKQKSIVSPDCAACPSPWKDCGLSSEGLKLHRQRPLRGPEPAARRTQPARERGMEAHSRGAGRSGDHTTLYGLRVHGGICI